MAHTWTYQGYPGNSEVIFELFPEGEKTRLRLTHSGLGSFPDDAHFARHRFEKGWKAIIGYKLKHYLEKR
ncbi:SRPBCC family protein [Mucilaginibacter roseus]|uniref:SRPBCC family protein n=1 Tax=Mucilaginibacter roseus TaxID=1528868 RepID=UPI00374D811B